MTCARVDNRPSPHVSRHAKKKLERPIDWLRSRGEATLKASGDKGARLQLLRKLALEAPSLAPVILFTREIALRFVRVTQRRQGK
jgi:hypothetical protein